MTTAFGWSPTLFGQSTPSEEDRETPASGAFQDQVSVRWVLVPITVHSARGYAKDLEAKDFRLFIDGEHIPFDSLDRGNDAPFSLIYLQDLSGSMSTEGKIDSSRQAFGRLLSRLEKDDELALASFAGGRFQIDVPFTDEKAALSEAADLWEGYGTTSLYDAVSWLPEVSAEGKHAKRVAILVSDGLDNDSKIDAERARDVVRRADLPVYVIGLALRDMADRADTETVTAGELLNSLAYRTGGRFLETADLQAVDGMIDDIVDELRLRYILAFRTHVDGDSKDHQIRVELAKRKDYKLVYRRGYRGGAPVAASP